MKKSINIFIISIVLMITTSCNSAKKTDNSTNNADTSGYKEQPSDKTQINDTMQMQSSDTMQLHPDTIPY